MKLFAAMFESVDGTTSTNAKVEALASYFKEAPDQDKVWAIAIMSHRRPKRPITTTLMREWAAESAKIPNWLFEESYHIAGDLAETICLLTHARKETGSNERSLTEYIELIIDLKQKEETEIKKIVQDLWESLDFTACFIFNKLLTGGFRMGISQKLMTRALAKATGEPENELAHKLMGNWDPQNISFQELVLDTSPINIASKPYPFYLAYSLEKELSEIGEPQDWSAEWKWDGIRGQVIKRENELFVWTRGEELVTERYPEFEGFKGQLADGTVLDGEILAFKNGVPMDFKALQKRTGRKTVSKKLLSDVPIIFMAYDILESDEKDIRHHTLIQRRALLQKLVTRISSTNLMLSPHVDFEDWAALSEIRQRSREKRCEGFMLKRKDSPYELGRKKGNWWKWKVDPFTIDAVLTFAMRGHGRRANLYTDYTFGLWQEGQLVTFAKAYSGLTDSELKEVDAFVKKNTLERFGPVRRVEPELVFEVAFEGIASSSRHKSGVAVRFPRILRWRRDKSPQDANSIAELKKLIVDLPSAHSEQ